MHNIKSRVDKRTGKILEENPDSVKIGDAAIVEVVPLEDLIVDVFQHFPKLGRFVIIDNYKVVGVGVIKQVESKLNAL